MKKVNLSKLHKLISRLEEEIKEKQHDVRLKGSVRYTLKTADDKYPAMVSDLRKEQEKADEYVRAKIALLPYWANEVFRKWKLCLLFVQDLSNDWKIHRYSVGEIRLWVELASR